MNIEHEVKLDYSDVLLRPKRSILESRSQVSLERKFSFINSKHDYNGVPIAAANMDGVGTFEMAEELANHGMFTCLVKNYSTLDLIKWIRSTGTNINEHWAYCMGITSADYDKFVEVRDAVGDLAIKYVCIDVANGYTERFNAFVKQIRTRFPFLTIIAGNVVTAEMTQQLILSGADIVKVGIGPGSVCTTRIKTGVGYPQLSAVMECADAAHGLGGLVMADGGCTCPGDVAKAFAAGADFVMLGGMLAGHDQGGGEVITKAFQTNEIDIDYSGTFFVRELKKYVQFYGMSSKAANEKHFGGLKDYRAAEGREVLVPYRGNVIDTVQDILGGLRSACTYVGASQLKHLSKCATFVRTNSQYNKIFERNA